MHVGAPEVVTHRRARGAAGVLPEVADDPIPHLTRVRRGRASGKGSDGVVLGLQSELLFRRRTGVGARRVPCHTESEEVRLEP